MKNLNKKSLVGVGMMMLVAALGSNFGSTRAQAATRSECGQSTASSSREVLLPAGTEIRVRLLETVTSASAAERQPLLLETLDDIVIDGKVVVASGSRAEGTVVRSQRRHGFGRRGKLSFTIDRVQAVDGEMLPLGEETSFRGNERYNKAAVITLLFGPFGIFVKGGDVEVPAGTELSGYSRVERLVRLPKTDCSTRESSSAGQALWSAI